MVVLTRHAILALLLVLCMAVQQETRAAAGTGLCGKERNPGLRALDESAWRQLGAIHDLVVREQYDEALAELQGMLGRAGRDVYLQAILEQALAQVEWSRENFDQALGHLEKAVELDALPNGEHFALMYQIAQLYFAAGRFRDALDRLDLWFCTSPPEKITAASFALKAAILVQLKNNREALVAIEQAIMREPEPQESWYQLELAAHFALEQYPQAAGTLETLIVGWPGKKMYWTQLSQTYFNLKQNEKALAVASLAYRLGLMDTQSDLLYLSSLYANADIPYKAAAVLQNGIENRQLEASAGNWTRVADSWYAAGEQEKALAAYERAGVAAGNGEIDLRRAYILVDMERWQAARDALDAALAKSGFEEGKLGEAYLLHGMVEFNLGNLDRAGSDWAEASRFPRTRDAAQQWINHLREVRKRRAS